MGLLHPYSLDSPCDLIGLLLWIVCLSCAAFTAPENAVQSLNEETKWSLFSQTATRPVWAVWVADQLAAGNVPLGTH